MSLPIHLTIHFLTGVFAGLIAWLIWRKPLWAFSFGILGGFLIDVDHLFDYFLTYGWHFNLQEFLSGQSYETSRKMLLVFHGWEFVLLSFILVRLMESAKFKTIFFALALGMMLHLSEDVLINRIEPQSYSVLYRIEKNFNNWELTRNKF